MAYVGCYILPRAMPWAKCFCPLRGVLLRLLHTLCIVCELLQSELVAQCELEYAVLRVNVVPNLAYAEVVATVDYEVVDFV